MYAVVHLPDFRLQAVLRGAPGLWEKPVALIDPTHTVPRVIAMTGAARAGGVELGLTPTQAAARCAGVLVRHASAEGEAAAADSAIQAAYGFSPWIEASYGGGITMDLRGLAALAGAGADALARWAAELRKAMESIELRARVGVGPTPNIARHAARWSHDVQVVDNPAAFVASLPLSALDPSDDAAAVLAAWGLRNVGELLALGQADVADRLGLEGLALFAAASTTATRPLRLTQPAERYAESFDFPEPVETAEPLLFLLRRFVDQLCARLAGTGMGARQLRLMLRLDDAPPVERALRIPHPTRDPDILFRALATHLETLRTESPVVSVALEADPAPPGQRQFDLFAAPLRDPRQFHETLARLAALVGPDRVGSPVRMPGHHRDAFQMVPPNFDEPPPAGPPRPPLLRPTPWRRLRPAPAADVEADGEEGRPAAVRSPAASGRITLTLGPWRASGRWWEPGAWSREDWEATTQRGVVVRLSRSADGWRVTDILD
jgi:protein ImuB